MASAKLKFAFAALAFAGAASTALAQTSTSLVRNITVSEEFQKKLDDDYGAREIDVLKRELQRSVDASLKEAGPSKVDHIDLVIEDAKPNKPTFRQLSKNTALSFSGSLSTGGAKVEAKLYDASDTLLTTVNEQFYSLSLTEVFSQYTWGDADRAFDRAAYSIRKEVKKRR